MTREQKATKGALWLERWQGCLGSGVSVAEYARRQGFDAQEAYRWKRILRRTGRWIEADGVAALSAMTVRGKVKRPARFARVALTDPPVPPSCMLLRLVLGNGRRAELEVAGTTQLAELIGVLERTA